MGAALLTFENNSSVSEIEPVRTLRFATGLMTIHADSSDTGGQYALVEIQGSTGAEPPLHVHHDEDEFFLVLEGQLKVRRGNDELTLNTGDSAFLPRNVPHTFRITSEHVRFMNVIAPGGFEEFFREMGQPLNADGSIRGAEKPFSPEKMLRVAARYNCTLMP